MTASEFIAFLIVNCNVSITFAEIESLSLNDPIVSAINEAWRQKQDREMERFALLAAVFANAMGGNNTQPSDFFSPMSEETQKERRRQKEAALKGLFVQHNASLQK